MKTSVIFILLLVSVGLQACTDSSNKTDKSSESTQKRRDSSQVIENGDTKFLVNAARGGMMEVELGKLAQSNSSNERVKNFGAMMEKDHGRANDQIKALAAARDVVLPQSLGEAHSKDVERLRNRKGATFDLAYMRLMVRDHRHDIKKFKDASKDATDTEIRAFAIETLPVLQKHLDSAKNIHTVLKPAIDNVIVP